MSTSDSDRAWLPREIRELGLHGIDGRSQHVADAGDLEDFIGKPIDHRHRGSDHLPTRFVGLGNRSIRLTRSGRSEVMKRALAE
jgi:hypothetical protein